MIIFKETYNMENVLYFWYGLIVAAVVVAVILFQFIDEQYDRKYTSNTVYSLSRFVLIIIIILINYLYIPFLNLMGWVGLISIYVLVLYKDNRRDYVRVIEVVSLIFILSLCETVGYYIFKFCCWQFGIQYDSTSIIESIERTFSKLVVILIYHLVINKMWNKDKYSRYTREEKIAYVVIVFFSLINVAVLLLLADYEEQYGVVLKITQLINMLSIILVDLYLLYFLRYSSENYRLKERIMLMNNQTESQYSIFREQEKKYLDSVKILHDVKKHMDVLQEMYSKSSDTESIKNYRCSILEELNPFKIEPYTNNLTLNILLTDNKAKAEKMGIRVEYEIGYVDVDFMYPIEITTLFGNIIDNAIEAASNCPENHRFIKLKMDTYNDIVVINLQNSFNNEIDWREGKPVSKKGEKHGYGLLNVENVVEKYNGNIQMETENDIFTVKVIVNG